MLFALTARIGLARVLCVIEDENVAARGLGGDHTRILGHVPTQQWMKLTMISHAPHFNQQL